jgi:hypothetical protein
MAIISAGCSVDRCAVGADIIAVSDAETVDLAVRRYVGIDLAGHQEIRIADAAGQVDLDAVVRQPGDAIGADRQVRPDRLRRFRIKIDPESALHVVQARVFGLLRDTHVERCELLSGRIEHLHRPRNAARILRSQMRQGLGLGSACAAEECGRENKTGECLLHAGDRALSSFFWIARLSTDIAASCTP